MVGKVNLEPYIGNYNMTNPAANSAGMAGIQENTDAAKEIGKTDGVKECKTCASRRYQDGSNDPGVSFKSPTKLNPSQAASQVVGHEREHYSREDAKANSEGREVLSNNVQIFTAVCPECGKTYVAGGQTTTVTRAKEERGEFALQFFKRVLGDNMPQELDVFG